MNFRPLENDRPFAKIAFEGFAGDGKTYTAALIAIGIHKLIQSKKPIAVFDTEKAFKALKPLFDSNEIPVMVDNESRSLASLSAAIKWCEEGNADVLLIDSITHVWESYMQAYMTEKKRTRLEFQDWGVIKPKWKQEFSTPFVQAKCHIIFTGRAGFEYENEINPDTKKREIFKSGIKMKAENETAFEPDILVLMEKQMDLISDKKTIYREATIIKDRTAQIDGQSFKNPTFENFFPAIKTLLDGTIRDYAGEQMPDTFEDWETRFSQLNRTRNKVISEIEGIFNYMGLGTSGNDKKLKAATLNKVFNVLSIDRLEDKSVEELGDGLNVLKDFAEQYNKYMNETLAAQGKPDMKYIGEILEAVMTDEIDALFGKKDQLTEQLEQSIEKEEASIKKPVKIK